jgi:hypothetical protein
MLPKMEMLRPGGDTGTGGDRVPERHVEKIEPDPRESRYELPPVERRLLASEAEKRQAILRMLEQAARERAAED